MKGKKWTQDEIKVLYYDYKKEGLSANVLAKLPNRTETAIRHKISTSGLYKKGKHLGWSQLELDALKAYYPTLGIRAKDKFPNRSLRSIQSKAVELGLRRDFGKKDILESGILESGGEVK